MTTLCSRALQFRYPLDTTTSTVRSAVKKTNLTETLIQWIRLRVARHLQTPDTRGRRWCEMLGIRTPFDRPIR